MLTFEGWGLMLEGAVYAGASEVWGVQVGVVTGPGNGARNYSPPEVHGAQVGGLNVAEEAWLQVGLFNTAAAGLFQLGVVNAIHGRWGRAHSWGGRWQLGLLNRTVGGWFLPFSNFGFLARARRVCSLLY